MADNYLITGYWGTPHVTAENDRGIQGGIVGAGRYVLPVGKQFRAEYIGNNTVRIYDGKLMDNGAAAGIAVGEYIDLSITNTGQNKHRNDLIVFQYSRDTATMVESGSFILIKGAEVSENPKDPALTQADLLAGNAVLDQMPLWRIRVSGATIAEPERMFTLSACLADVAGGDHNHGGITTDGKLGTVSGRIVTTSTGGVLEASTASAAREKLGLAPVAASGSYNDLTDKPTIVVDSVVTASGKNAVTGAAVASYVSAQIAAIANFEEVVF